MAEHVLDQPGVGEDAAGDGDPAALIDRRRGHRGQRRPNATGRSTGAPVASSAVSEFQTSPGMRDILAPESDRWRRFVEVFADVVEPAGYELIVAAAAGGRRVFERRRRGHRRRRQGDVPVHRPRRPPRRPAARADRQRVPGVRRAPPDDAVEGVVRRARTSATRSRSAAATASSTRSASRSLGVDDPYLDVEVIALGWRFYRRPRPAPGDAAAQLARRAGRPGPLRRRAAAPTSAAHADDLTAESRPDARRATRCACSTPSGPPDAAVIAAAPQIADFLSKEAGRPLRRRARRPRRPRHPVPSSTRGSCAASTTTCARRSSSPAARSTRRRTRSVAAVATTASSRRSAARRRRASGSPSASTARCWPATTRACSRRPTERVDVFVVDTTGGREALARHRAAAPGRALAPTAPTTAAA